MICIKLPSGDYSLIGNGHSADPDISALSGMPAPIIPNSPTGHNILKCLDLRGTVAGFPEHEITEWNNESLSLPVDIPEGWFGNFPPLAHQILPLAAMIKYNHHGLFLEMGLGKTWIGIHLFRYLYELKGIPGPYLVTCPRMVIKTWEKEIRKYSGTDLSRLQPLCLGDDLSVEVRWNFVKMALRSKAPMIIITSYDTFSFTKAVYFEDLIVNAAGGEKKKDGSFVPVKEKLRFGSWILDESTKIKSTSTERWKGINKLKNLANRRYILTGFPSPQSPADYVGQVGFMHPLYLGYNSTYSFTQANAIKNGERVTEWRPEPIKLLKKQLKVIATHQNLSQTSIKLPQLTYKSIAVEMSKDQRSVYDQFAVDYVAFIKKKMEEIAGSGPMSLQSCEPCDGEGSVVYEEGGNSYPCLKCKGTGMIMDLGGLTLDKKQAAKISLLAQNALVKMQRLLQITGGWAVSRVVCPACNGNQDWTEECKKCNGNGDIAEKYLLNPNPKFEALTSLVHELENEGEQYVIFSHYRHELEHMALSFGIPIIYGGTKQTQVADYIKRFQAGEIKGIAIQPSSGGIGVDGLQCASTAIYYTNGLKLEDRVQSEKRLHRIGQTKTVKIVDIVQNDSIDERVRERLLEKKEIALDILKFPEIVLGRKK